MAIIDRGKGRKAGRWQVRYRADGKQHARSFNTRDEADAFEATTKVARRRGEWANPQGARTSFTEYADQVFATWEHLRPTTVARYRSALVQIKDRFDGYDLGDLDRLTLQAWVSEMKAKPYAPATIAKACTLVYMILDSACQPPRPLLTHNAMLGVKRPPVPHKKAGTIYLDHDQIDRLADAVGNDYRAAVYVGAYCGLRAGELLGLRVRDLDMLRKTLFVCNAVWEANGQQGEGEPKTAAGIRRVPIAPDAHAELAAHLARQNRTDPDAYVFAAPRGGAWRATNFRNRVWRQATIAAGLDGMVIHELRHTACAHWIDNGATPEQVREWAGHRSVSTVFDRYGHLFPHHGERVMANLQASRDAARRV